MHMKMKKMARVFVAVVLAALSAPVSAAGEGDVVSVHAAGLGLDESAAIREACRQAVEKAVGLYVDAQSRAKNDQLIEDQVLTHSNAYIRDYEVKSRGMRAGLVEVKVVASVQKQKLTHVLQDAMKEKQFELGLSLKQQREAQKREEEVRRQAAEKEEQLRKSQLQRDEGAAALLEKALGEFVLQHVLYDIVRDESVKPAVVGGAGQENICFGLRLKVNEDRYFKEVVPRLRAVLEKVSVKAPEEVSVIVGRKSDGTRGFDGKEAAGPEMSGLNDGRWMGGIGIPDIPFADASIQVSKLLFATSRTMAGSGGSVALLERYGARSATGRRRAFLRRYVLAPRVWEALARGVEKWNAAMSSGFTCEVSLSTAEGTLTSQRVKIPGDLVTPTLDSASRTMVLLPFLFSPHDGIGSGFRLYGGVWYDGNGNSLGRSADVSGFYEAVAFSSMFDILKEEVESVTSVHVKVLKSEE